MSSRNVQIFTMILLAVMLVCLMASCGQSSPAVLRAPPALAVSCGNDQVAALQGTASWFYREGNGGGSSTYDGSGTLALKEQLTPLLLPKKQELTAYLTWEVMPDSVSVCFWGEECWGKTDVAGEEILAERQSGDEADHYTVQMKDGNYIYEVYAEWTGYEQYGGTAYYSFCTEKK